MRSYLCVLLQAGAGDADAPPMAVDDAAALLMGLGQAAPLGGGAGGLLAQAAPPGAVQVVAHPRRSLQMSHASLLMRRLFYRLRLLTTVLLSSMQLQLSLTGLCSRGSRAAVLTAWIPKVHI